MPSRFFGVGLVVQDGLGGQSVEGPGRLLGLHGLRAGVLRKRQGRLRAGDRSAFVFRDCRRDVRLGEVVVQSVELLRRQALGGDDQGMLRPQVGDHVRREAAGMDGHHFAGFGILAAEGSTGFGLIHFVKLGMAGNRTPLVNGDLACV